MKLVGFLRRRLVSSSLAKFFIALYFFNTHRFYSVDQSHGDGLPVFLKVVPFEVFPLENLEVLRSPWA